MSKVDATADDRDKVQSLGEEIANAVTHGIGAGLSIAGLIIAVVVAVRRGDRYSVIGAAIFGATLVLLYMASTLFHAFQRETVRVAVRRFFHIVDYIGIGFLIAGTYTPFALKLRDVGGWTVLVVVWSLAVIISIIKTFFAGRFNGLTALAYVAMGWMGIFMLGDMMTMFGIGPIIWLLMGGAAYTVGVIPFLWEKLPFNHAIWHLFVMVGSICHFFGIVFHILPTA